jgi:heme exporter protein D
VSLVFVVFCVVWLVVSVSLIFLVFCVVILVGSVLQKHNTENYKDERHKTHQKHNTENYKDE